MIQMIRDSLKKNWRETLAAPLHKHGVAIASRLPVWLLPGVFLVANIIFFSWRVSTGLHLLPFVDEMEHLLGGKMLNHGAVLYRDFISQHGPVVFMFTQAYGWLCGWQGTNNAARFISVFLAGIAAICVAASPAVTSRAAKCLAISLFVGLVDASWLAQGFYLINYHAIAGFVLVTALALFFVPLWLGQIPGQFAAAAGAASLIIMTATAYSYGVGLILLGVTAVGGLVTARAWGVLTALFAGGLLAMLGLMAWMLAFGDFKGYLAFHFIENQTILPQMLAQDYGFTWSRLSDGMIPNWHAGSRVHALGLTFFYASYLICLRLNAQHDDGQTRRFWLTRVGMLGLLAVNARLSNSFQDGCFLIGCYAVFAIMLVTALERFWPTTTREVKYALGTLLCCACLMGAELTARTALFSPSTMTRAQTLQEGIYTLGARDMPLYQHIRDLTRPDDQILALPYYPNAYFYANRPPMARYFYYLPWDAAYAKHPFWGQTHDLCAELPKNPPAIIDFPLYRLARYKIDAWGMWDARDYMPCLFDYMKTHYRQDSEFNELFVRSDIMPLSPRG